MLPCGQDMYKGKEQGKSVKKDANLARKKSDVAKEVPGVKVNGSKVAGKSSKSEIDDIFGNKKRKVVVAEQVESAAGAGADREKNKNKKVKGADAVIPVQRSPNQLSSSAVAKPRKKTIDGYTVFTEDEIGFGKKNAGGTPLCPFDCDCCF